MRRKMRVAGIALIAVSTTLLLLACNPLGAGPGDGGGEGGDDTEPSVPTPPRISPEVPDHFSQVEVQLLSDDDAWELFYTLDGSDPDASSTPYSGPFVLESGSHTVRAVAMLPNGPASEISEQVYEVAPGILVTSAADDGPGSLREAIAGAEPGEEIRFAEDMVITLAYATSDDRRGLEIESDVYVNGVGRSIVIASSGAQRHFTLMDDGISLRLAHMTLRNGAPSNPGLLPGGSVYASAGSDVTLESMTFADNLALRGGAVYIFGSGSTLTVRDSRFERNEARGLAGTMTDSEKGYGGAVAVEGGSIDIEGSVFEDNFVKDGSAFFTDSRQGGAIALLNASGAVRDSEFNGNEAWGVGGALGLTASALDVIRTHFQDNAAGIGGPAGANVGGGAIYSGMGSGKTIRIGAASFVRNQAAGPDEPSLAYRGGAIYNSGSILRVASSRFFGNGAPQDGRSAAIETNSPLTVRSSAFVGNYADPDIAVSGAIYTAGNASIRFSSFSSNVGESGSEHIHFRSSLNTYDLSHTAMEAANYSLAASVTVTEINNVTDAPGFTVTPEDGADNLWGTSDDDYGDLSPAAESPLIDVGTPDDLWGDWMDLDDDGITGAEREVVDAAGNPREVGTVDIGAYERQ